MDTVKGKIRFLAIFLVFALNENFVNGVAEFAFENVDHVGVTMHTFAMYREFYRRDCKHESTGKSDSSSEEHEKKFKLTYNPPNLYPRTVLYEMKCIKQYALNAELEKLDPALLFVFLFLKYFSITNTIFFIEGSFKEGRSDIESMQLALELSYFAMEIPEDDIINALKYKYERYGSMDELENLRRYFDELEKDIAGTLNVVRDLATGSTDWPEKPIVFSGKNMYDLDIFFAELLYGSISCLPKTHMRDLHRTLLGYTSQFLNPNYVEKDSRINAILSSIEWRLVEILMDLEANEQRFEISDLKRGFQKAKLTVTVSVLQEYRPPKFKFEVVYPRGSKYKEKHVKKNRHESSESSSSESGSHQSVVEKITNLVIGSSNEQFEGERRYE